MKKYFEPFYKSLYDFLWIREQKDNLKFGFLYFCNLMLLLLVVIFVQMIIYAPKTVRQIKNFVAIDIPEFTLQSEDGLIKVDGLEQPFIKNFTDKGNNFVLIVDTNTTSTINLKDYLPNEKTSGFLLTQNEFQAYSGDQGQTKIQNISRMPNFSITKNYVVGLINKWSSPVIYFSILLASFVAIIFLSIGKLIYLAVISLILLAFLAIAGKKWSYRQIFTISLFAVTLPIVITKILNFIGFSIPFLYTIIFLIVFLIVVFGKKEKEKIDSQVV